MDINLVVIVVRLGAKLIDSLVTAKIGYSRLETQWI